MPRQILIIDDSATMRGQIKSALETKFPGARVLEAPDGLRGFKLLVEKKPDLVVCDLVMPVLDGWKFLDMLASRNEVAHTPVLVLTGEDQLEKKVAILDRGAADYVVKPVHDTELVARVRVHLRIKELQDELREANARLSDLVRTDGLTGVLNRRCFDELLTTEAIRAGRYKTPFSIILTDIDHFKAVNDTYGHPAGDAVLRNVSRVLAALVRKVDSVARFGGEEFVLLLPETGRDGARILAERLRSHVEALSHPFEGQTLSVTASFGVSTYEAGTNATAEELIKSADEALYRAKNRGRNRVEVA